MPEPHLGDRVRTKSGATGRYLDYGLAMYVSAQDNDLVISEVNLLTGDPPHPTLPVPSPEVMLGAITALRYARSRGFDA